MFDRKGDRMMDFATVANIAGDGGTFYRRASPVVFSALFLLLLGLDTSTGADWITESFDSPSAEWSEVYLQGESGGSFAIEGGRLRVGVRDGVQYGVYHSSPVSGHFDVEASFEADERVGLALIQEKGGRPDTDNFTMLTVGNNSDGVVVVSVKDRQQGKDNVLDNTGELAARRERRGGRRRQRRNADTYEHTLTGEQYSVPFDRTNKRIRIFRDSPAGFFHFYYAVKRNIRGQDAEGWMELVPSKDWGTAGQRYYVALVCTSSGEAVFDAVKVVKKPEHDRNDRETGFKAVRREYNWSGFFGDAMVITFGDEFKYRDRDIKFVFWSETNFVPAWHLHNQLLFTYEFVETWGGGNRGCHEPMSDRLHRWTRVEVTEDNDVRKVVHWHYVLCNPDYKVPDDDKGEQVPEVDEYWTFYRDGRGTRRIVYTPKLDTDFRAPHELAELITIAGSLSHSEEYFASPALTFLNLEGDKQEAHPGPKFDYGSEIDDWPQVIMAVHFKKEPDIFCAFSTDPDIPETFSGYKIRHEVAWQNTRGRLSHWPVGKRPFVGDNGSGGTWAAEVSHSCLVSCGVRDGESWDDHFKVDERGRKYREWVMFFGANGPGDLEAAREKTRSWIRPGKVSMLDDSSRFVRNDTSERALIFENNSANGRCHFAIDPGAGGSWLNPVMRIGKWGNRPVERVALDDVALPKSHYRTHLSAEGSALIWISARVTSKTIFKIDAESL